MFNKLESLLNKYEEINMKLSDPETMSSQELYKKLMIEHSSIEPLVMKFKEYKSIKQQLQENQELLNDKLDKDFKEMVEEELQQNKQAIEQIEQELKVLLIPKEPNDDKSVIVEIRGGAGGDEAALFAGNLFRMYSRYAERNNWPYEILDSNPTEIGGYKEIVFSIEAKGAYSKLKFESGVHRVQRIPTTESGGRIHTSTVTVAVLPEAGDVDIKINTNDLRIDTYRSSGAGGQHVNKTSSAIRITHLPSGLVVTCQDQRSQHKNKDKAMKVLRSKLLEMAEQGQASGIAQDRKSQVGTGDRSERIRTYNFPQGRVTDHRIALTLYKLDAILDGDIIEILDALNTAAQAKKMSEI